MTTSHRVLRRIGVSLALIPVISLLCLQAFLMVGTVHPTDSQAVVGPSAIYFFSLLIVLISVAIAGPSAIVVLFVDLIWTLVLKRRLKTRGVKATKVVVDAKFVCGWLSRIFLMIPTTAILINATFRRSIDETTRSWLALTIFLLIPAIGCKIAAMLISRKQKSLNIN